jgi:hypothetical protein
MCADGKRPKRANPKLLSRNLARARESYPCAGPHFGLSTGTDEESATNDRRFTFLENQVHAGDDPQRVGIPL